MSYLTTIAVVILSISVLMLSRAVYRHLKMHVISSYSEELVHDEGCGIANFYLDIFRGSMYTKAEVSDRFSDAAFNEQNRQLYPYRYRHGATLRRLYCCNGCTLVYLEPEESADITYKRLTGGKFEYHSWSDIDRYFLKCSFGNVKRKLCPAWKELENILASGNLDVAERCDNLCVRDKFVGHANGPIGPISEYEGRQQHDPFFMLSVCCDTCRFRSGKEEK